MDICRYLLGYFVLHGYAAITICKAISHGRPCSNRKLVRRRDRGIYECQNTQAMARRCNAAEISDWTWIGQTGIVERHRSCNRAITQQEQSVSKIMWLSGMTWPLALMASGEALHMVYLIYFKTANCLVTYRWHLLYILAKTSTSTCYHWVVQTVVICRVGLADMS
jgi:hypothetical protein